MTGGRLSMIGPCSSDGQGRCLAEMMDADHAELKLLICRIGSLLEQRSPDRRVIGVLLDQLVVETRAHFERENAMMTESDVEEFARHRQDHHYLLKCLTDFAEAFRWGALAASAEVARDLDSWLSYHIQRFDSRLCELLAEMQPPAFRVLASAPAPAPAMAVTELVLGPTTLSAPRSRPDSDSD